MHVSSMLLNNRESKRDKSEKKKTITDLKKIKVSLLVIEINRNNIPYYTEKWSFKYIYKICGHKTNLKISTDLMI